MTRKIGRSASLHATRRLAPGAYFARHLQVLLFTAGRLSRTPVHSFMTVAVIGIALALPAGLHALLRSIEQVSQGWDAGAQISVFLRQGIAEARTAALRRQLQARADIQHVQYITREQALEDFRRLSGFGDALEALDDNPLPPVLVVSPDPKLSTPEAVAALQQQLQALPDVDTALLDMQWVQRLFRVIDLGRRSVLVLAAFLGLGVMLIVGNTLRLAIENHRHEIELIKLIGGTDAFIRRPFLYTGLLYGLLGAVLAWLLVTAALYILNGPVRQLGSLYHGTLQLAFLGPGPSLALVAIGIGLGLLGAWVAVGRHLRAIEPT